jgi:hypothetical protein
MCTCLRNSEWAIFFKQCSIIHDLALTPAGSTGSGGPRTRADHFTGGAMPSRGSPKGLHFPNIQDKEICDGKLW